MTLGTDTQRGRQQRQDTLFSAFVYCYYTPTVLKKQQLEEKLSFFS